MTFFALAAPIKLAFCNDHLIQLSFAIRSFEHGNLHRIRGDESVDMHGLSLAYPMATILKSCSVDTCIHHIPPSTHQNTLVFSRKEGLDLCLVITMWVPIRIVNDHCVCAGKVDSQTSSASREQKAKNFG